MDYPLFIPPSPLSEKPVREWSPAEAEAYFNWLLSTLSTRTDHLLSWFGESFSGDCEPLLDRVGIKVVDALRTSPFSIEAGERRKLTNQGYSVSADAGLLVARCLQKECGDGVRWEILKKPKRELAFNLPVLVGFDIYLDPVGGVIAEANAVLRGERGVDFLSQTFTCWKAKAKRTDAAR